MQITLLEEQKQKKDPQATPTNRKTPNQTIMVSLCTHATNVLVLNTLIPPIVHYSFSKSNYINQTTMYLKFDHTNAGMLSYIWTKGLSIHIGNGIITPSNKSSVQCQYIRTTNHNIMRRFLCYLLYPNYQIYFSVIYGELFYAICQKKILLSV